MKPSALPGGAGLKAQLYRAFQGTMIPYEVDHSTLPQLAALLGMDEDDASGPMPGSIPRRPRPSSPIAGARVPRPEEQTPVGKPKILAVMDGR